MQNIKKNKTNQNLRTLGKIKTIKHIKLYKGRQSIQTSSVSRHAGIIEGRARLDSSGRIVVPGNLLSAMDLKPNDVVNIRLINIFGNRKSVIVKQ